MEFVWKVQINFKTFLEKAILIHPYAYTNNIFWKSIDGLVGFCAKLTQPSCASQLAN